MTRTLVISSLISLAALGAHDASSAPRPASKQAPAQPPAPAAPTATIVNFDQDPVGRIPAGWKAEGTNQKGPTATWRVEGDNQAPSSPNVLSLTSVNHDSGDTFNICWCDAIRFTDGAIEVKLRANTGEEDQGGGLIWRVRDKDNYLVARYNPLEENYRVYYVKDGGRKQLATAKVTIPAGRWITMRVEQSGNGIKCSLDGRVYLEVADDHLAGAGGVGLWTKADAATSFDDLTVTPAPAAGAKLDAPGSNPDGAGR